MKNNYSDEHHDNHYSLEEENERIGSLEERQLEIVEEHIRSQGGDYWQNDAGEWCCG